MFTYLPASHAAQPLASEIADEVALPAFPAGHGRQFCDIMLDWNLPDGHALQSVLLDSSL